MKNLLLFVLVPAFLGITVAWAINYSQYGYREAKLGPFQMDDSVTVANLGEHLMLDAGGSLGIGRVKLIGEPRYDFGVMAPGKEGEHEFTIRNVGDGTLELRVGKSTCKCTLGELKKTTLDPGEETDITLTWTPKPGEPTFKQMAELITNDPDSQSVALQIVGKVISDFEMSPMVWTFGEVATGEPFEVSGNIFNFSTHRIEPTTIEFSDDELNEYSTIEVEEIPAEDFGKGREEAVEGFRIVAKFKPGMKQRRISQNLLFHYQRGERVKPESKEEKELLKNTKLDGGDWQIPVAVKGRVVGKLRMIESSKLKARASGGYLLRMGKLTYRDKKTLKCFVVLKGAERETTKLSIGEVSPAGTLKATLGEAKGRGKMVLYPLTIELVPGDNPVERLGKNEEDFGKVLIESDNSNVGSIEVAVTFALESE